jgi:hypothetical protein
MLGIYDDFDDDLLYDAIDLLDKLKWSLQPLLKNCQRKILIFQRLCKEFIIVLLNPITSDVSLVLLLLYCVKAKYISLHFRVDSVVRNKKFVYLSIINHQWLGIAFDKL